MLVVGRQLCHFAVHARHGGVMAPQQGTASSVVAQQSLPAYLCMLCSWVLGAHGQSMMADQHILPPAFHYRARQMQAPVGPAWTGSRLSQKTSPPT